MLALSKVSEICIYKMVVDVFEVLLDELVDELAVLEESWEAWHVNVSQLAVLNQRDEEPEAHYFIRMEQ
jgi:hypothetical protein